MSDSNPPSFWVAGLVSLFTAVVVTVFSTWLSADANRSQTLRADRRTAYAALLNSTANCESNSILAEQMVEQASMFPVTADSRLQTTSLITTCSAQMNSAKWQIMMVADDDNVIIETDRLITATTQYMGAHVPGHPHDTEDQDYYQATSDFFRAARKSALVPTGPPIGLIKLIGTSIVVGLLIVVCGWLWNTRPKRNGESREGVQTPVAPQQA